MKILIASNIQQANLAVRALQLEGEWRYALSQEDLFGASISEVIVVEPLYLNSNDARMLEISDEISRMIVRDGAEPQTVRT